MKASISRRGLTSIGLIVAALVAVWLVTVSAALSPYFFFGRYSSPVFLANTLLTYLGALGCYVIIRGKSGLAKVALNLVAVSFIFVAIELPAVVGLVDYRALLVPRIQGAQGPRNRQYEPEFYFHRPAYDSFEYARRGDLSLTLGLCQGEPHAAQYRYDKNGFRNDSDLSSAPLVLIGDSFVEGYNVSGNEMLSTKLGKMLNVDVANLGMADTGPVSQLAALRLLALDLQPEIIVWFYYEGNDLHDYEEVRRQWGVQLLRDRLFITSALRIASGFTFRLLPEKERAGLVESVLIGPPLAEEETTLYFEALPNETDGDKTSELRMLQEILGEAKALAEEGGTRLVLVYIPIKARVYEGLVSLPEPVAGLLRTDEVPTRLAEWAALQGVEYVDLTSVLQTAAKNGQLVYYPDDSHWSPIGHSVAAAAVAEALSTMGF